MTETMTQQEANHEAKIRWGRHAWATWSFGNGSSICRYTVGTGTSGSTWDGYSEESFEAAFADAERKEKRG